jgi:beta-phosphoglucomutase
MLKSCIFNLDGVVVDTAKYHYIAWKRLANDLGFDITEAQHETLRGFNRMTSLEKMLEWGNIYLTEAEKLHYADVKNNWYVSLISNMNASEVLPGVLPFLQELKVAGIKTVLSSGSKNARTVIQALELEHLFDLIIDGNTIRKPAPDLGGYLRVAEAFGLSPRHTVIFDDLPVGIEAGRFGGFFVIGVGRPQELHRAHHCIPDFRSFHLTTLEAILPAQLPMAQM